mmetsp:Transcript_68526/g.222987  ORF Transcript_68526/g.222987 Transcript_68526/m.222987 type:complete len:82 (-) Transcript_68526:179-424(-)
MMGSNPPHRSQMGQRSSALNQSGFHRAPSECTRNQRDAIRNAAWPMMFAFVSKRNGATILSAASRDCRKLHELLFSSSLCA